MQIQERYKDPVVNIALDTIEKKKQALIFVNTKRSAEKVAEDIAKKHKKPTPSLIELSDKILRVIPKSTKQCQRLAFCVRNGIAFHHAGLHSKQKDLVENAFRAGIIKIIGCTPTLAAGLDLPAFRAIIRDVKRYTQQGYTPIPVLEFLQMAGRAGRPNYDTSGEAIVTCNTEAEKEFVIEKYLNGFPEDIYSKLAVEPVLRTYLLSLISSRLIGSTESIFDFFSRTFWAFQYKDEYKIKSLIEKALKLLLGWEFLTTTENGYRATSLGRRVAELYLDPLTAHNFINGLKRANSISLKDYSWLQLVCNSLEMRPLIRVRQKEFNDFLEKSATLDSHYLTLEPSMFEPEYNDWLDSVKTSLMVLDWIDEKDEEWILETYNSRPGETRTKIDNANWLLYSCHEIARILGMKDLLSKITKVRMRIRYGVKEELLPLIRFESIGRARARKLFREGIKDVKGIKNAQLETLKRLIGEKVAISLKQQVGKAL
jgi:helicase